MSLANGGGGEYNVSSAPARRAGPSGSPAMCLWGWGVQVTLLLVQRLLK